MYNNDNNEKKNVVVITAYIAPTKSVSQQFYGSVQRYINNVYLIFFQLWAAGFLDVFFFVLYVECVKINNVTIQRGDNVLFSRLMRSCMLNLL